MSLKNEYNDLKNRLELANKDESELVGKKKVAEAEIAKLDTKIKLITKGKDPTVVMNGLEKEIETRLELIESKLSEYEKTLETFLVGDDSDVDTLAGYTLVGVSDDSEDIFKGGLDLDGL